MACSSSDTPAATPDAGSSGVDATTDDVQNTSSSSSSSSGSTGDGGLPAGFKDPNTVPGVSVKYGTCDAFTKCDSSIIGSWNVSGGCLSDTTFDQYKQLCSGLTVHDVIIKASGTVTADDTTINRATSAFVQADVDIDKSQCAALALFGGQSASCASLNALLTTNATGGAHFDNAQCADGAAPNVCDCVAQATVADNASDTYTETGGTITTTGGAQTRTFDYCGTPQNAPTATTYQETTAKNATFGMFLTITKQ